MRYFEPKGCCGDLLLIDISKVEFPSMEVELMDRNLWVAMATIIFNPLFWNIVARWEYRTQGLSKTFKSRHIACFFLGVCIFLLGVFRDKRFNDALNSQPRWYALQQNYFLWSGYLCIVIGCLFVFSSYFALGFYGTFLGDYFGILMEEKVTGFPFNVLDNPMYWGSTLNFLGAALVKASQSGLILTGLVAIVYKVALVYEGPFTVQIYAEKESKSRKKT